MSTRDDEQSQKRQGRRSSFLEKETTAQTANKSSAAPGRRGLEAPASGAGSRTGGARARVRDAA